MDRLPVCCKGKVWHHVITGGGARHLWVAVLSVALFLWHV